jgi:hypothetical protein
MTPAVLYPDAEAVLVGELRVDMPDVTVVTVVPVVRPAAFLLVRRVGGPRLNIVADEPLVAIEAWAASDEAAQDLAQRARAHLHALRGTVSAGGVAIYRVQEASGPQRLPDATSTQSRYTFTASVAMRGQALNPGS